MCSFKYFTRYIIERHSHFHQISSTVAHRKECTATSRATTTSTHLTCRCLSIRALLVPMSIKHVAQVFKHLMQVMVAYIILTLT